MVYFGPATPEPERYSHQPMNIERSALVRHPAENMYALVRDVTAYPEFLRWCTRAEVHEESAQHQVATLGLSVAGIEQSFTTRNRLEAARRIDMELERGPFRSLSGNWRFNALGEKGSKIILRLEFEVRPGLISAAFERGFKGIADHMVQEFVRRANALYRDADD
jgi:ribosome-associated toxin RatA of RatAB toxin-antitoxin module